MKIPLPFLNCGADTVFILIISKGHNSAKNIDELWFFFSAYHLEHFICTKFLENILDGIKVIERT